MISKAGIPLGELLKMLVEGFRAMDKALDVRSVTRSDKNRFEAAMTLAFSADPAARWAWPDPLQYINTFKIGRAHV